MQNKINLPIVSEHYSNMSEGDKSCVVAMLQHVGAEQMTSIGSSHDKFYEELSKSGWVESVEISPELEKVGSVRSWKFTEVGNKSMSALLLALTTSLRNELRNNRYTEFAKFGAKLFMCYVLSQSAVFSVGWMIGKMGINISAIKEYLSIAGLLISLLISLFFASKICVQKTNDEARIRKIAYCEFLNSEIRSISVLSAVIVLTLHLIIQFTAVQLGWQNEAKSFTRLLIQCVVLGGVVWWFTKTFLPTIMKNQHSKQFKAKKRP